MKAIHMTAQGDPSVLRPVEVEKPLIQAENQVLVEIKAAGVNPVDTKLRRNGSYYPENLPCILGCDAAGIILEKGSAVTSCEIGDEVYYCYGGIGGHPGNYAEYNVVPEYVVARKPRNFSFIEAAAAPLILITAWESLFDQGKLQAGQRVLIHAGAGGVGHVAIQLAKAFGAHVITTVSTPEKAAFAAKMGADEVILYPQQNFIQTVLDWTHGTGVDLAVDTVGGKTFEQTLECVAYMGKVVTLLQPPAATEWKQARTRNLQIGLELMLTPMYLDLRHALEHQGNILQQCTNLAENGKLHIHVGRTFSLRDVSLAHQAIEQGHNTGKFSLEIS